ncbi:hypothetical protein CWE04_12005 [Thomasclavelia cocleata]|uniref:Uncharacterized protein n=1 Tax=Thomasclavelia cocleata TaxID=69824 RepID=A0A1I0BMS0_9FIRM|nr:hypothetical protein [Thomasclavelia cocleata]MCR1960177.1 hypothetical protein [Thomasclavelia cocleata]NDO41849.1 hypothetical protein [Thomasclavelia cocleata]PJN79926.1 hypothetical protein CWE04_12005 [Thomasclavelia cocleata]SET08257.1 hypothetical protein SAMN04489758_101190 [Thomasclavelia cocleata]
MQKKCIVCGKIFNSKNGVITCSHECYLVRKREHYARGNFTRYSGQKKTKKCPVCKKIFYIEKKHLIYCSVECREIATKEKKKKYFKNYYEDNKGKIIERVKRNNKKTI